MNLSVILGENSRSVSIMAELYLPAEVGVVARSGNTSLVLQFRSASSSARRERYKVIEFFHQRIVSTESLSRSNLSHKSPL